jgi:hypothetical protein
MPLIQRIGPSHTIREFRAAALLRFREASRLAIHDHRLGAIYLCGYAAEMLLKAGYFRLAGKTAADPVPLTDIQSVKKYATAHLGLPWPGNLHDLRSWTALLVEERKYRGVAYQAAFARSLVAKVQRLYLNWHESLRYRANRPYAGEMVAVLSGVQWLLGQYRYL